MAIDAEDGNLASILVCPPPSCLEDGLNCIGHDLWIKVKGGRAAAVLFLSYHLSLVRVAGGR